MMNLRGLNAVNESIGIELHMWSIRNNIHRPYHHHTPSFWKIGCS